PVDPCSADGQITLLSCLWPDQRERIALLRGALEVARRVPLTIDAAGAPAWLAARLAAPARGVASVVFHSIVMQYLSAADRRRGASVRVRFLVDTGALYTVLPERVWRKLGLKPTNTLEFGLADGTAIVRAVSEARFEIARRTATSPVVLGERDDAPLLGAVTLE